MNQYEFTDDIPSLELGETSKQYMMLYGINIIVQRAIPMLVDGLKPVHRRIMWAMYRAHKNNFIKVAEIQGDTLKFSPHSELGTRFIVAGLAQPFSNNVPFLTPNGNCGTATAGDDCGAARYWSARISDFSMDVFFSEFDAKVNMKPNYDGEYMEPITFPAKFPTILLNGSNGIAYTMSSDLLPYNLNEIADATIKLLKNPEAKVNLIPDSPTGCDILKRDDQTFVMQSSFDVDNLNYTITFKNTPYGEYLNDINKRLCAIQDGEHPIKEILSAEDESELSEGKIRYVVRCKPCNLYQIINQLFKRVPGFRVTVSTKNAKVIDTKRRTQHYNERQILCAWISNRLKEKRSYYLRKLVDKTTEHNMMEAKVFMLSPENLNKTIKVFRKCEESDEIVQSLMETYKGKVSSSQANYISDMKMNKLTNGEYVRTLNKLKEISDEIKTLKEIVNDPNRIRDIIIDDIKEIKEKYGCPRRSKILNHNTNAAVHIGICQILTDGSVLFSETENPDHFSSDVTPIDGDEVCLIDKHGRFLWVNVNKIPQGKPMTLTSIGRQQMDACIAAVSKSERSIVMLSNKGRIKLMPTNRIPSNQSRKPLIPLNDDEYLVSILEVNGTSDDLLMYTTDGLGKRFSVSELNMVNSPDAQGQFIVKEDCDAAGIFIVTNKKPLIFYVTRLGRVRLNQSKFLVSGKKFGGLKPIIKLSSQDDLIAVFCCDPSQAVTMYHADGRVSCVNVNSLQPVTMNTPPAKPKHVPGIKVIRATLS
jgi:DNA gyrase/topoisomerase IV subunit A